MACFFLCLIGIGNPNLNKLSYTMCSMFLFEMIALVFPRIFLIICSGKWSGKTNLHLAVDQWPTKLHASVFEYWVWDILKEMDFQKVLSISILWKSDPFSILQVGSSKIGNTQSLVFWNCRLVSFDATMWAHLGEFSEHSSYLLAKLRQYYKRVGM